MTPSRGTPEILRDVRELLRTAKLGLADVRSPDPLRRAPGLSHVAVYGRAVTNVLQNLRSTEPQFDEWYTPFVEEMRADPLLRYFYTLRTDILKQGRTSIGARIFVHDFDSSRDAHHWGAPPPGATGKFLGDSLGGSGWFVRLPDGTEERVYVSLPREIAQATLTLPDAPSMHLGTKLQDDSVETLASAYVRYLEALVANAQRRFADPHNS